MKTEKFTELTVGYYKLVDKEGWFRANELNQGLYLDHFEEGDLIFIDEVFYGTGFNGEISEATGKFVIDDDEYYFFEKVIPEPRTRENSTLTNFTPRKITPVKTWKSEVIETITIGKGDHYPEVLSVLEVYNPEDTEYPEFYALAQHHKNKMPHMLYDRRYDKGEGFMWKEITEPEFCSFEETIHTFHNQPNKQLQAYTFLYTYMLVTANIDIHKDFGVM